MKNNDFIYDWIDFVAEHKEAKKLVLKEQETKKIGDVNVIVKHGLEFRSSERTKPIKGVVIHHTAGNTPSATFATLKYSKSPKSTNYEVDKDGTIYEYIPADRVSWATGGGANEHTIGIDLTHLSGAKWPPAQIDAVRRLVQALAKKYNFGLVVAPDKGPMRWPEWQKEGGGYTLFRHRNFVNTGCPENFPMDQLTSGGSSVSSGPENLTKFDISKPETYLPSLLPTSDDEEPGVLSKAYDYIKDLGSSAWEGIKSLFTESIDEKLFHVQDKSKNKIYENNKKYFDSLLMFLKKELKITKPVKIILEEDDKNSKKVLGRTGGYVNQENKIHIFVTNRHIKDVLRSLAHEMVHHRQNIRGDFSKNEPTIHGYAQQNPHLRKMEKEAYLKGNITFRDWEDDYKYRGKK